MPEKTFTQAELDKIIGERLARKEEIATAELEKRERELQQQEFNFHAKMMLHEKGLPLELLEAMNMSNKDAFTKSIELLGTFINKQKNATHDPLIREAIKQRIVSEGARPQASDLMLDAFNFDEVQHEDGKVKNLDEIVGTLRGKYADFFGTVTTEGAQLVTPPQTNSSNDNNAKIREAMGIKKG